MRLQNRLSRKDVGASSGSILRTITAECHPAALAFRTQHTSSAGAWYNRFIGYLIWSLSRRVLQYLNMNWTQSVVGLCHYSAIVLVSRRGGRMPVLSAETFFQLHSEVQITELCERAWLQDASEAFFFSIDGNKGECHAPGVNCYVNDCKEARDGCNWPI